MVKSKIVPYKFADLSMVKNIWTHSKNIEDGQKILNAANFVFEIADGLGIRGNMVFKLKSSMPMPLEYSVFGRFICLSTITHYCRDFGLICIHLLCKVPAALDLINPFYLLWQYTNSLVNADLFYANFTNTTFQNILILNTYYETESPSLMQSSLHFLLLTRSTGFLV